MRLRVTADAADDLHTIKSYLTTIDGVIAERVIARVGSVIETLLLWPRLGHVGHRDGTYEMLVPRLPFVIVYRIDLGNEDELIVLRVFHLRQDRS